MRVVLFADDPCEREFLRSTLRAASAPVSPGAGVDPFLTTVDVYGTHDLAAALVGDLAAVVLGLDPRHTDAAELTRAARRARSAAPVVLVVQPGHETHVLDAFRAGLSDYVPRPEAERLPEVLRECLARARQQEAEARQAGDTLRLVLAQMPAILWSTDAELRVTLSEGAGLAALGLRPGQTVGLRLQDVIQTEDPASQTLAMHLRALQGESTTQEWDYGGRHWQGHLEPLRDANGTIAGCIGIVLDVTERQLAVEKVREQEALLARARRLESLGTLAGGIAHDLNNILTPIQLSIDLLATDPPTESRRAILETLQLSVHRSADMVRQVLLFSRDVEGPRQPLRLRPVLDEVEHLLRHTLPRSIVLDVVHGPERDTVHSAPSLIHQALLNLCVNARDAMPHGGRLRLEASNVMVSDEQAGPHPSARPGPHVRLAVTDTGTGIPPEARDRLFDPFFTTKEPGKGTGLGLSTVLGIARSHNGFLEVESPRRSAPAPGEGPGAEFRLYLPAAPGPPAELPVAAPEQLRWGRGERVLLVEDEAVVRDAARTALERFGYRVLTAADGAEGVARLAAERGTVAVAVVDMIMPIMDGAATIRALRRIDPALPIVATSGLNAPHLAGTDEVSAHAFLPKPYSIHDLLDVLHTLLARPR